MRNKNVDAGSSKGRPRRPRLGGSTVGRMPNKVGLNLRVLGYKQGRKWTAHCLEMDLIGEGRSFEAALDELKDAIALQVSFAYRQDQSELLSHPAPPEFFAIFEQISRKILASFPHTHQEAGFQLANIPVPQPRKLNFAETNA